MNFTTLPATADHPFENALWSSFVSETRFEMPDGFMPFLREYHGQRFTVSHRFGPSLTPTIGLCAHGVTSVMSAREIRDVFKHRGFGQFLPFLSGPMGFVALDFRQSLNGQEPSVVFLDDLGESFDETEENSDHVFHIADTFSETLRLFNVWSLPSEAPLLSGEREEEHKFFDSLGVLGPATFFLLGTIRGGAVLRSGVALKDGERLAISHAIRCIEPPVDDQSKAFSLHDATAALSHLGKLVPIMVGKDGWLALDYRTVDSSPPVVVVRKRADGFPDDQLEPFADSIEDAFNLYQPGPISDSIHKLEGWRRP